MLCCVQISEDSANGIGSSWANNWMIYKQRSSAKLKGIPKLFCNNCHVYRVQEVCDAKHSRNLSLKYNTIWLFRFLHYDRWVLVSTVEQSDCMKSVYHFMKLSALPWVGWGWIEVRRHEMRNSLTSLVVLWWFHSRRNVDGEILRGDGAQDGLNLVQ